MFIELTDDDCLDRLALETELLSVFELEVELDGPEIIMMVQLHNMLVFLELIMDLFEYLFETFRILEMSNSCVDWPVAARHEQQVRVKWRKPHVGRIATRGLQIGLEVQVEPMGIVHVSQHHSRPYHFGLSEPQLEQLDILYFFVYVHHSRKKEFLGQDILVLLDEVRIGTKEIEQKAQPVNFAVLQTFLSLKPTRLVFSRSDILNVPFICFFLVVIALESMVVVVRGIQHSVSLAFFPILGQRTLPERDDGFYHIWPLYEVLSDWGDDLAVEQHVSVYYVQHLHYVEVVSQNRLGYQVF